MNKQRTLRSFEDSMHITGRIWMVAALIVMFAVPVIIGLENKAFPDWGIVLKGLLSVAPIFWTVCAIEVFTYAPMIGAGGTYIGFVTGNLTGIKIPAAMNAMDGAKVKAGTKEGEIISTIAIATSSIVTTIIVVIGVVLFAQLKPILSSPTLRPAFNMILPALFGGLGIVYIIKSWKVALPPIAFMVALMIFAPAVVDFASSMLVPVCALLAIGAARLMYNWGWLGEKGGEQPSGTADSDASEPASTEE